VTKRLNLGCGLDYKEGWINADLDKNVKADLYFDIRKKFPLKDSQYNYILIQDLLEHLTKEDGRRFLEECWRILAPGGKIEIRIPNVFQIFKQFKKDPEVLIKFIYGNTEKSGEIGAHKFGYTKKSLIETLKVAGFRPLSLVRETTNYVCVAEKTKKKSSAIHILISGQDSGGIGGSERFLCQLATQFQKKGVKTSFLVVDTSDFNKYLKEHKEDVLSLPFRMDIIGGWKGFVKFFLYLPAAIYLNLLLLKKFKEKGGDFILIPGFSDKLILTPLAKLIGLSVIWLEYAPLWSVFKRNFYIPKIFYRLVKRLPDKVIVPTENTKKSVLKDARVSEAKIITIPLGIEIFSNSKVSEIKKKKKSKKEELGVQGKKIVGMISRIEPEKGQDTLIKAVGILKKKIKNINFLIMGNGGDVELLKTLARKEGVSDLIKFLGFCREKEKWEIISTFDIFVFPTRWKLEGFGLVSLEAMMMKIPLITSNFGPVPEVVGDAAYLVEPKPEEIAESIEKLLDNKELAQELIKEGRKRAEMFEIGKITEIWINEIRDLKRIYG
jgi:glycosyltransferase involved in cell wall biosynthesis/predicted SAM-dependent methyltransferase